MERPTNPFREGSTPWEIMEMALQEEFDGLPGTSDLTITEIAEILCRERQLVHHSIRVIREKTGYIVPYVKMAGGRKRVEWQETCSQSG